MSQTHGTLMQGAMADEVVSDRSICVTVYPANSYHTYHTDAGAMADEGVWDMATSCTD